MGNVISSMFGGNSGSIDMETPASAPVRESTEPVSSSVRDIERKRLMARRAMNGTLLTQGNKGNGAMLLGRNGNEN